MTYLEIWNIRLAMLHSNFAAPIELVLAEPEAIDRIWKFDYSPATGKISSVKLIVIEIPVYSC